MKIAVITPVHLASRPYLDEAYASLCAQTSRDWTWWLLENHGGRVSKSIAGDPRVRVLEAPEGMEGIGALKRHLCDQSTGEAIVELDADDRLHSQCLERVAAAFDSGADVVYSDFAEFTDDPKGIPAHLYPYGKAFGWQGYLTQVDGESHVAMRAPEASAHNLRRVEWAPNHVRAWTRAIYERVGGHDPTMAVGDDHDLLVRMFLAGGKFRHLPECLYLYRVHGENTVRTQNAAIQEATGKVYNRAIWPLAEHWAREAGLIKVDLCGGIDAPNGYLALDKHAGAAGADVVECDLEGTWPLKDSSVGVLRAHDALEHLKDPVHTMNEAFRVLAPGGFFMISVPSTNGNGAFCDPTHVSFWNRLSFRYYTNKAFARYIPAFHGKFQASRVLEWYPSKWHDDENVPYVEAHLFCAKDGFRAMGEWGWDD